MSNVYELGTFDYHSPDDLAREAADHEFGARYDDNYERFAAEVEDLNRLNDAEADYELELCAREAGLTVEAYKARELAKRDAFLAAQKCADCKSRIAEFLDPCPF